MPPVKRIITKNLNPKASKPPVPVPIKNEEIDIESELKFDQEVLWCITQLEKLMKSGTINDAKKNESMRVISTLKRTDVPKIQKIQLMRQYFKDYKSKMHKDEEIISKNVVQFKNISQSLNGKFFKKKVDNTNNAKNSLNTFQFNFKQSNEYDDKLSNQVVEKLNIKE